MDQQSLYKSNNEQSQIYQEMNKNKLIPSAHTKLLTNKLSNIEQDMQLQSQIRIPSLNQVKRQTLKKELRLETVLDKILKNGSRIKKNASSLQTQRTPSSRNLSYHVRSQNLPQLRPLKDPKRNKSSLDKILADRSSYAKAYFEELSQINRVQLTRKEQQIDKGIQFQFPQIKVGLWNVTGYLKDDHILLKGVSAGQICIKKYLYKKIYEKMRHDYQSWVGSKFNQLA